MEFKAVLKFQLHIFLIYIILASLVSTILESKYPDSVLPALARALFTLFQGSWLFEIGFVLYYPISTPWDQENHIQVCNNTLRFIIHAIDQNVKI